MTDHRIGTKEGVLASLVEAVSKVKGIKHIDRQKSDPKGLDRKDYPGVFVTNLRLDRHTDEDEPDVQNVLTIALIGFVWADKGESLGEKLEAFIDKVQKAVLADKTRNGNAENTEVEVVATDAGMLHPKAEFIMALIVRFWTKD